jgi:hypothetical protein
MGAPTVAQESTLRGAGESGHAIAAFEDAIRFASGRRFGREAERLLLAIARHYYTVLLDELTDHIRASRLRCPMAPLLLPRQ